MRHHWRALVTYKLDDEDAAKFYAGPPGRPLEFVPGQAADPSRLLLRAEMVDQEMTAVVCIVCELDYMSARHKSCRGEPVGYTSTGEPRYRT